MNEQDFDNRIRKSALNQEAQTETPFWDKKGTWDQIEAGLGKGDRTIWWKVAAVLLLFFSIGMSYAQWERFRNFRSEKETELNDLRQQVNILATGQRNLKSDTQLMLQKKSEEIDSLKNQLLLIKTTSHRSEVRRAALLRRNLSVALQKQNTDQDLIDSLKNTIHNLQATAQKQILPKKQEQKATTEQKPETPESEISPEHRIYYISNHLLPKNPKGKKGLKIGIFGASKDKQVKYQSNYSIFKK